MEGTLRGTFPVLVAVVKDQGPLGGELDCVLGGGDGGQSGGESELRMAKEMDSILHHRFNTLNPSW